jgi:hypothetical protein
MYDTNIEKISLCMNEYIKINDALTEGPVENLETIILGFMIDDANTGDYIKNIMIILENWNKLDSVLFKSIFNPTVNINTQLRDNIYKSNICRIMIGTIIKIVIYILMCLMLLNIFSTLDSYDTIGLTKSMYDSVNLSFIDLSRYIDNLNEISVLNINHITNVYEKTNFQQLDYTPEVIPIGELFEYLKNKMTNTDEYMF